MPNKKQIERFCGPCDYRYKRTGVCPSRCQNDYVAEGYCVSSRIGGIRVQVKDKTITVKDRDFLKKDYGGIDMAIVAERARQARNFQKYGFRQVNFLDYHSKMIINI
mgnify:CR=1 FL=1|jgi:hypothetical protein|tara:strand:- start:248 stop:568 length:321 start_codon:yes stop_codon:yes gene_type:complete